MDTQDHGRTPASREAPLSRDVWRLVPNLLTMARLALLPVVVALVQGVESRSWPAQTALAVFAVMAATDALDGLAARRLRAASIIGMYLDPMVDKIVATVLLVALAIEMPAWFPSWMVLLIVARDIAVQGFRSVAPCKGVVLRTGFISKSKAAFQFLAVLLSLLATAMPAALPAPAAWWAVRGALAAALAAGYVSMALLFWQHGRLLRRRDIDLTIE